MFNADYGKMWKVVATGVDIIDPTTQPEYKYGVYPNVIHRLQVERLLAPNWPTGG